MLNNKNLNLNEIINGISNYDFPPIINIENDNKLNNLSSNIINLPNNQQITYKQNIIVRWLKPETPPPAAPIIIREIESPPEIPPPIIYREIPQCPKTPPPIILRDEQPVCQSIEKPIIIEKCLSKPCQIPQIIIRKFENSCLKPQKIICQKPIEKKCPIIIKNEYCHLKQENPKCKRLIKEIIRTIPQKPIEPTIICKKENKQNLIQPQSHCLQQFIPVYALRQHIVQPKGIRVIRQVIGTNQT